MDGVAAFSLLAVAFGALSFLYVVRGVDPAWIVSVGIAGTVFSGHWQDIGLPGLVVPPDRLLIWAGLATAMLRRPEAVTAARPGARAIRWLLALTLAYAVGSAAWVGTLGDSATQFRLLDVVGVMPFLLFLAAPAVFATARQREILLATLVATGAYLGATSLLQFFGADALVFPQYIADPTVGIHAERARGPFVEAVANGLALYACGVASAIAVATWRRSLPRVAAATIAGICALDLILTLTRAIWIAAIAATLVTLLVTRELRRFAFPAVFVGTAFVVATVALAPGLSAQTQERRENRRAIWDRLNSDKAAARMIADRPLLGFGFDRFDAESPSYYRQSDDYPLTGTVDLHNVFLRNAVDLGLVGAALWLGSFLLAVGGAILRRGPPELRPWRLGLLAYAVFWVVVANFGPLPYPFAILVLWVWAGIVFSAGAREQLS
ncbi:MAG: O-antigen ligase family protein [Gaiellaceae bacterium]